MDNNAESIRDRLKRLKEERIDLATTAPVATSSYSDKEVKALITHGEVAPKAQATAPVVVSPLPPKIEAVITAPKAPKVEVIDVAPPQVAPIDTKTTEVNILPPTETKLFSGKAPEPQVKRQPPSQADFDAQIQARLQAPVRAVARPAQTSRPEPARQVSPAKIEEVRAATPPMRGEEIRVETLARGPTVPAKEQSLSAPILDREAGREWIKRQDELGLEMTGFREQNKPARPKEGPVPPKVEALKKPETAPVQQPKPQAPMPANLALPVPPYQSQAPSITPPMVLAPPKTHSTELPKPTDSLVSMESPLEVARRQEMENALSPSLEPVAPKPAEDQPAAPNRARRLYLVSKAPEEQALSSPQPGATSTPNNQEPEVREIRVTAPPEIAEQEGFDLMVKDVYNQLKATSAKGSNPIMNVPPDKASAGKLARASDSATPSEPAISSLNRASDLFPNPKSNKPDSSLTPPQLPAQSANPPSATASRDLFNELSKVSTSRVVPGEKNKRQMSEQVKFVEIPREKGMGCPNCRETSTRVVFCPYCGSGMCANCSPNIRPEQDFFIYTCPRCGEEINVSKK